MVDVSFVPEDEVDTAIHAVEEKMEAVQTILNDDICTEQKRIYKAIYEALENLYKSLNVSKKAKNNNMT